MTSPDFSIEFVRGQSGLTRMVGRLCSASVVAVDIETVEWWNRFQERIALVQTLVKSITLRSTPYRLFCFTKIKLIAR